MERILIIADNLDVTGPCGDAPLVACSLMEEGVPVEIWQLCDMPPCDQLADVTRSRAWPSRFCTQTRKWIRAASRQFEPTAVVCFGEKSLAAGVLARGKTSVQLVAYHGLASWLLDGHLNFRQRWQLAHVSQHVVATELTAQLIQQRFPKWKVKHQPLLARPQLTVDSKAVKQGLGLSESSILVATSAPLTPSSRLKDYIWACDLVTCIRDDVYWLIIGEGELDWRLRRFEKFLEIGDHLRYQGWSSSSDELIAASDIYIQTSASGHSRCGLATAVSLGKPCVASNETVHTELVQHGVNGYLVEKAARNEFARCVNRLANQPAIAERFGCASRKISEQTFSRFDLSLVFETRDKDARKIRAA